MSKSTRQARPVGKTSDEVDILLYEGTTLDMYHVTFYGTLNSSYVLSPHVWPYSPEAILKYGRKGHGCPAVFKQAMKDIENEKLFLIAEPLEFPPKETDEIMKGQEGKSGVDENENVKEDAGELTGEETVDDAIYYYKIYARRQHGSSTVESPNKSSSSKTNKMSVPVSPAPTPSEKPENSTSISMDTEVSDQDSGSTGDILGHGAPPTPSSGALPPLEKQRPFMMNDFRSHSQGVNSPPSAFGPGMTSSVDHGWNNNYGPAPGHNCQPFQPYPPYPPIGHQNPNPFRFNPPPYCNYNTATAHVHSIAAHDKKKRTKDASDAAGLVELPSSSTSDVPASGQLGDCSSDPFQSQAIAGSSATIESLADSLRSGEPEPELPEMEESLQNDDAVPYPYTPSEEEVDEETPIIPRSASVSPTATAVSCPKITGKVRIMNVMPDTKPIPVPVSSGSSSTLALTEAMVSMDKVSPSPSPSPSNISSLSGHNEQIQVAGGGQETFSGPAPQQPEEDEQDQQLLSETNRPSSVLRTSIRNRNRADAAAAAAADAAAASATATTSGYSGSRPSLDKIVKNRRTAGKATFIKNPKKTASAANVNDHNLRDGNAAGSVLIETRQGIQRLYDDFTLDGGESVGGVPKKRRRCIVVGCRGYVAIMRETVLKHISSKHLNGDTNERSKKIYVPSGAGKNKGKLFSCNFQDCQVKGKGEKEMAKHTYEHLTKTVDCSIEECGQKFLYTSQMREHVERDHTDAVPE